jgi:hypothetical protein
MDRSDGVLGSLMTKKMKQKLFLIFEIGSQTLLGTVRQVPPQTPGQQRRFLTALGKFKL